MTQGRAREHAAGLPRVARTLRIGAALLAAAALGAGAPRAAEASDPFLRRTPTVGVVQEVGPAVVNITTQRTVQMRSPFQGFGARDPFFDRFFERFFEPRMPSRSVQSLGSGVIIDREGHVLTNAHVVARADQIRVKLADGREFDATAVGADPNNDLAVLRVETDESLPWVSPGRSDDLMVGEPVIAIGNPFGLSNTVTTGVISALDRSIRTERRVFHGFLQTDASINPGNSGGPLLNAEGALIGINTAIYGNAEGIGFAIPIDVAERIVRELIAHGEVAPVWLGLELQALDDAMRRAMELPAGLAGALVRDVDPGGPADQAGVRRGDVVVRLENQAVTTPRAFYEVLGQVTTGTRTRLEVRRDGRDRTLRPVARALPDGRVQDLARSLLGAALAANPRGGYVVQSVRDGSGAERIGLQAGDLIVAINGRALRDDESLKSSVLDLRGRSRALVVVQRSRGRYHVTIPLG